MDRFYVTTPIYYVNDEPHIGHAFTTLNADAVARWHRMLGEDVFFLTGTDEHGLKIQRAAEENGLSPLEQADRTSVRFKEAWRSLNISNDDFIRTTEPRHHVAVQQLLQRCYDNGYIERGTYEGSYCVSCEAYYTDDELGEDRTCPIHKRPVEHMVEDNYFFKLSAFEDRLTDWLTNSPDAITPDGYRKEALGLIRQGLEDISISRTSIDWGVPVPWDDGHVFYVWYDALINYATAVGFGSDDARFEQWWPATHHMLGKDILRFHCVYWPAMLLAAGIEDLPTYHVHGFLLVSGEKMSKTSFNKISPTAMVEEFGVDGFRYALLRDHSFGPDSDFSYESMLSRYNSDLANTFGNLLQRVTTIVGKKCGGVAPAPRVDSPVADKAATAIAETIAGWAKFQAASGLDATWRLAREANELLSETEPWKLEPGPEVDAILGDALEALRIVALLGAPAMPEAMAAAWARLGLPGRPEEQRIADAAVWGQYPGGVTLPEGEPLFPRLKAT
ncbi:MAG: methionine--tRNA ligase [Acidimicrobiales bacterium]|nr:methionine--tRNA ligase [Acidimicrobiales bacterium]